jgi:hypothetical protein
MRLGVLVPPSHHVTGCHLGWCILGSSEHAAGILATSRLRLLMDRQRDQLVGIGRDLDRRRVGTEQDRILGDQELGRRGCPGRSGLAPCPVACPSRCG